MARKRTRGNGEGSLFRRRENGPWVASWYNGEGRRRERSTGTTSRSDAERIARKWVERAAMEREGLVAPEGGTELDRHAAATITSHLEAFEATKQAEGRSSRHVDETVTMIRRTADACGWRTLGDLSPDELEQYIARKRAPIQPKNGGKVRPWTPRTAHKYITALRTFTRWCVADGRLAADPLARIKKPSPTRQRSRRFLTVDEWRWLRHVTEQGEERAGMSGHARRLLYETAIQTGLRSKELRSLKRTSLVLDATPPYILLEARQTKNKKSARQYIRPELAADLSQFGARLMPGADVFDTPRREHMAKMLRADLEAARTAWLTQAGADADERTRREASDFLRDEDHDGRVLDFHALRHTCGAWAAMSGASPKAVQTLMRHSSITLTLDTYGHLLPDEAAETVARMPGTELAPLRLTGTETADEAPAVDYATAGRNVANWRNVRQNEKPRFAAEGPKNAVSKRGGRDSNPQPPDRQSIGRIG